MTYISIYTYIDKHVVYISHPQYVVGSLKAGVQDQGYLRHLEKSRRALGKTTVVMGSRT